MKFDQSRVVHDLATTLATLEELTGPLSPKLLPVLRSLSSLSSLEDGIVYDARIKSILSETDPQALRQAVTDSFKRVAGHSSHNRFAIALYEELVALGEPDDAREAADLKLRAAHEYRTAGQLNKAETLILEAMAQMPESDNLYSHWMALAGIRQRLGNFEGAIAAGKEHLAGFEQKVGVDNPVLISSLDLLIGLYDSAGQADQAAPLTIRRRALKKRMDG